MKLYTAEIKFDIVVVAETETMAREIVGQHATEELRTQLISGAIEVEEVTDRSQVSRDWLDSIPWGSKDDATVADFLKHYPPTPNTGERRDGIFNRH